MLLWCETLPAMILGRRFARSWLDAAGWDHASTPPELPAEVVAGTTDRYLEAFRRITGREPVL